MKFVHAALFVLAALLVLPGCSSDDEKPEKCDTVSDTSQAVLEAINTLIDPEQPLYCSKEKVFTIDGQNISFVYVRYGYLMDCMSGCFSTGHLCAVVDESSAQLYWAKWDHEDSQPLTIPLECPELFDSQYWQFNYEIAGETVESICPDRPSGYHHPLTQTAEFQFWRKKQMEDYDSQWHGCFR